MSTLNAIVHALRHEADDIVGVDLKPAAGTTFPRFEAGSHIDLHLPNGMMRSYSLTDPSDRRGRYSLGILNDKASRGGSRCVHQQLKVGMPIVISAPRNNFRLHEDAAYSVLVAGGIGITPILCMARRLKQLGRPFELHYFARSRRGAAFLEEIEHEGLPATLRFDDEADGPPDLKAVLGQRVPDAHTHHYACGPTVMLDAFERACAELGHPHPHIERFSATEVAAAPDAKQTFTVELKRSGRSFTITPEKSILDTLLDAGVNTEYSCQEGICGACETKVVSGVPDHRDSVLSDAEHASNKVMMICVSGCKTAGLVLDL